MEYLKVIFFNSAVYGFWLIKTLHYIVQCFIDILSLPLKNIVRQISLSISKKDLQIFDKIFVRFAPVGSTMTYYCTYIDQSDKSTIIQNDKQ